MQAKQFNMKHHLGRMHLQGVTIDVLLGNVEALLQTRCRSWPADRKNVSKSQPQLSYATIWLEFEVICATIRLAQRSYPTDASDDAVH